MSETSENTPLDPSEADATQAVGLIDHPDLPDVFSKVRHAKKRAFLLALTVTPNLSVACKVAGISRPTYYNWSQQGDADYDAAFLVARDLGIITESPEKSGK